MLLQNMRAKGRGKLADRWDRQPYVIVKQPDAELPVYVIRREVGDFEKVVHRNLLRPCSLPLPPEKWSLSQPVDTPDHKVYKLPSHTLLEMR